MAVIFSDIFNDKYHVTTTNIAVDMNDENIKNTFKELLTENWLVKRDDGALFANVDRG